MPIDLGAIPILPIVTAVSAAVGALTGYVTTRSTSKALMVKATAEAQLTIGQAWQGVVTELRDDLVAARARIDALDKQVDLLRRAELDHARDRLLWLEEKRDLEMSGAERQKLIDSMTAEIVTLKVKVADLQHQLDARNEGRRVEEKIAAEPVPPETPGPVGTA